MIRWDIDWNLRLAMINECGIYVTYEGAAAEIAERDKALAEKNAEIAALKNALGEYKARWERSFSV